MYDIGIEIDRIVGIQDRFLETVGRIDIDFRRDSLIRLKEVIKKNEQSILDALEIDLSKSNFEGYATEIGMVYEEINLAIKKIGAWSRRKRVKTSIAQFKSKSYIYREAYGRVLIIAPWNYPFQLVFSPLICAIAAGNTVIVKPSEFSAQTTRVVYRIIKEVFEEKHVAALLGDADCSRALLERRFDYIFFTGSTKVGKIVMEAAAKHLTPLTLELGGKSPCIVDSKCNLELAARRIAWGKLLNAGQTCVAPDYLLVNKEVKDKFLELLKREILNLYGDDVLRNDEYPKIINRTHFNRVRNLLEGQEIYYGGLIDEESLKVAPTIIELESLNNKLMDDELFAPIFPVIEYAFKDDIFKIIRSFDKPLALYLFTDDRQLEMDVREKLSFGGGCVNETIVHVASLHLPFGGIGGSGMGSYHGKKGFDTFSHEKSILKKSTFIDLPLRYPPYKNKIRLLKKVLK